MLLFKSGRVFLCGMVVLFLSGQSYYRTMTRQHCGMVDLINNSSIGKPHYSALFIESNVIIVHYNNNIFLIS